MIDEELIEKCENELSAEYKTLEKIALINQEKVLNAFKKNKVALRHFYGTSGYGYGDDGRDTLNRLFADIFNAEAAICSPSFVSGTHAISSCLYGVLRPNDTFLSISGDVYDTLDEVISGKGSGSLADFGIKFYSVALKDGDFDINAIKEKISELNPKMVYIQRSRGYQWRDALSICQIENVVNFLREIGFYGCIMMDNCYGEFTDIKEPIEVGVNLAAGSLIKNPGGGIAPTGGYVVGDKKYVNLVQNRLTAPSIGGEVGSYLYGYQYFYQGLFLAPHVVVQSLKGAMLFCKVLNEKGYKVSPEPNVIPHDIITMVEFGEKEKLIDFIQNIQNNSPIDSNVKLMPWDMPGYEDPVIMAAGCFVQGSSIELSADAPVKPPFIAYLQGGITYEHCKIALKNLDI